MYGRIRVTVQNSTDFRDAAIEMTRTGKTVHMRPSEKIGPVFRVSPTDEKATLEEILSDYPSIYLEEFASAMYQAEQDGKEVPEMVLFTID